MSVDAVIAELRAAGLAPDGTTATEEVIISTARSPRLGRSGGEVRTFGGRQRWALPGTNLRCTVGPRTVNVYTVHERGECKFLAMLNTKGIDVARLREALTRGGAACHTAGESPTAADPAVNAAPIGAPKEQP